MGSPTSTDRRSACCPWAVWMWWVVVRGKRAPPRPWRPGATPLMSSAVPRRCDPDRGRRPVGTHAGGVGSAGVERPASHLRPQRHRGSPRTTRPADAARRGGAHKGPHHALHKRVYTPWV